MPGSVAMRDQPPGPAPGGFVGVLMLDTRFARPVGDIGNPQTFAQLGIAVRHVIVKGASAREIVQGERAGWLEHFIEAALDLQAAGASVVTTTCGFLAEFQPALSQALRIPVLSSALLQCQSHARCGIVTFDAAALTPQVLRPVGVAQGTPIQGLAAGCHMQQAIYEDSPHLDLQAARADVVQAAQTLVQSHPEVDTLVLECANMPPYRGAVEQATGRRVLDALTMIQAASTAGIPQ